MSASRKLILIFVLSFALLLSAQSAPSQPPTPSDAKLPNPATAPSKPGIRGALPRCLDVIFHSCWMSPKPESPIPPEEKAFRKNREVADYYFKERNWSAAESRFRDALRAKPGDPETVFFYAETLSRLNRPEEARDAYSAYLEDAPNGVYAERCRTALQSRKEPPPQR
jgi:tetratricopeptide (TPR) repeat protein